MNRFHIVIIFLLIREVAFCQLPDTVLTSSSIPQSDSAKKISYPHPYHVNYLLTSAIIVAGNVGNVFAINRIKDKPVINDSEIASLNTSVLTGLDKWALKQDPTKRDHYDRMSDDVLTPIIFLPG